MKQLLIEIGFTLLGLAAGVLGTLLFLNRGQLQ